MNSSGKKLRRLLVCAITTIAIAFSAVFAEPVCAASLPLNPKLYKADKKLGTYLDKKLLAHKSTIVFYTKDKSLFSAYSPTLERKLDSCSTMLYGIKHNKSISYQKVYKKKVVYIPSKVEGKPPTKKETSTFAYYKVTIKPKYRYSKANDRKFYNKVKSVARQAKKKPAIRKRAKYINNYIINNVSYNGRTAYHNTAYSALMKGKATCQGYTDLFTIIARESGLKAETVCGYAWYSRKKDRAYHAWNVVKYGKKWVQLDVTFNDVGNAYKYFMINKSKFNYNHQLDKFYNNKAWKKAHPLQ